MKIIINKSAYAFDLSFLWRHLPVCQSRSRIRTVQAETSRWVSCIESRPVNNVSVNTYDSSTVPSSSSHCLLLPLGRSVPLFVFSWCLRLLRSLAPQPAQEVRLRPHPNLLLLSFLLCVAVNLFRRSKLGASLRFIDSRQPVLQHFQTDIPLPEPSSYSDLSYHPIILIASEDVHSNTSVVDVCREPFQCFLRVWLCFAAPVGQLWCVDASNSNV